MTVPLKPDYIIERSNGTEWYFYIPLNVSLKKCFNTEWSNGTYWVIFSNTIENTTKVWFIMERNVAIPLRVPLKRDFIIEWSNGTEWYWMVLQITAENTIESYWNTILNGPMVLNGIQWYTIGSFFVRAIGSNIVIVYFVTCQN